MKLTPDQLHRLIDEVAALAYRDTYEVGSLIGACETAGEWAEQWWESRGYPVYFDAGMGHAGLSAVLILLSEGG